VTIQASLFSTGSVVIFLWGVAHMVPTRKIVDGFGQLPPDNRRIITMEWLLEGVTLCFLGALVAFVAFNLGRVDPAARLVGRLAAAVLLIMAAISAFTGARTAVLPMRLCPLVKTGVALVWLVATIL
jgi:hypothetical protein